MTSVVTISPVSARPPTAPTQMRRQRPTEAEGVIGKRATGATQPRDVIRFNVRTLFICMCLNNPICWDWQE